jgi:hypothetical protein
MAERIIAYCGLVCSECPAYVATQANDMAALQKLAEKWSQDFGGTFTAEGCLCDGCLSDGRHVGYCSECQVRACATSMGVVNCAHCTDYASCEKLNGFLQQAPNARVTLEAIRKTLQ